MEKLTRFLAEHHCEIDPILDGQFHRFDRAGGSLNGWFWGIEAETDSGKHFLIAKCGDWRTGDKFEYRDEDDLSDDERAEVRAARAEKEKALAEAKKKLQEEVATQAARDWEAAVAGPHVSPYWQRKVPGQASHAYALRVGKTSWGEVNLLVPCRDLDGKLWGIQKIQPDGAKFFTPGQKVRGTCFTFTGLKPAELAETLSKGGLIYVCEGVATAASVFLATRRPTVAGFNAGNLPDLCRGLRERFPHCRIILAGDDDRRTTRPDGTPHNPGREAAEEAARAVAGLLAFPVFGPDDHASTDWNDLHISGGLDAVRAQLEPVEKAALAEEPGRGAAVTGTVPPGPAQKKDKQLPEQWVAERILKKFEGRLVKQDKNLFIYREGRWKELFDDQKDQIKLTISRVYEGLAPSKVIESTFRTLLYNVPSVPEGVNLFNANPFCVNFKNGTLHLRQSKDHHYTMEFLPHRMEDYLINILPYEYDREMRAVNREFEQMLDRVFEGDPDRPDKIRAIAQMMGACLVPAFPHFWFLYGVPGTGKSTLIQLAARLVSEDNTCSVEPHEFHGFNMESMVGKLVNFETDVTTTEPISDAALKKVIDRRSVRIRRKFQKDAYGLLPAVHIFGGNGIPPTLEGASRAHDRRWTFIGFNRVQTQGKYDKEFHAWVFDQSPMGVVNFALRGLQDLCQERGHYTNPESGRAKMEEWQVGDDPVHMFLEDVQDEEGVTEGNVQVKRGSGLRIDRRKLFRVFQSWAETANVDIRQVHSKRFYEALRRNKLEEQPSNGVRYFVGLGDEVSPSADY